MLTKRDGIAVMVGICMVWLAACGDRSYSRNSSETDEPPDNSSGTYTPPPACTPGTSLYCYECGIGNEGEKHCLPDGSGYGPCTCPNHCDLENNSCDSCQSCAVNDTCAELGVRCFQNAACEAIFECTSTGASLWDCAKMFPSGADDYVALGKCLFCDACPSNCQDTGWCSTDCVTACALKYPYGVSDGIVTSGCLACDACSANCSSICENTGAGSCGGANCAECMISDCAASVCSQQIASCDTNCQSFTNCIVNTCN